MFYLSAHPSVPFDEPVRLYLYSFLVEVNQNPAEDEKEGLEVISVHMIAGWQIN